MDILSQAAESMQAILRFFIRQMEYYNMSFSANIRIANHSTKTEKLNFMIIFIQDYLLKPSGSPPGCPEFDLKPGAYIFYQTGAESL